MNELEEVLRLADEYQMNKVAKDLLKRVWREIDRIPVTMHQTIKAQYPHDDDAYLAAVYVMLFPGENDSVIEKLMRAHSRMKSLSRYRTDCGGAARRVAQPDHGHYRWLSGQWTDNSWFNSWFDRDGHSDACQSHSGYYFGLVQGNLYLRRWWGEYMRDAATELENRPSGHVVMHGELFAKALGMGSRCGLCGRDLESRLKIFAGTFAMEIESAVSSTSRSMEM